MLDFLQPEVIDGWHAEDQLHDSGTVKGWAAIDRSGNDLQLGLGVLGQLFLSEQNAQASNSLSVESHVLGIGLRHHQFHALLGEISDAESVCVNVS